MPRNLEAATRKGFCPLRFLNPQRRTLRPKGTNLELAGASMENPNICQRFKLGGGILCVVVGFVYCQPSQVRGRFPAYTQHEGVKQVGWSPLLFQSRSPHHNDVNHNSWNLQPDSHMKGVRVTATGQTRLKAAIRHTKLIRQKNRAECATDQNNERQTQGRNITIRPSMCNVARRLLARF